MSPISFLISVICACFFFLISLNRWLPVSFSLNSKDFLFLPTFLPPSPAFFHGLLGVSLSFQIFRDFPDIFLLLTFKWLSLWEKDILCMTWILLNLGDLFHGPEYGLFWYVSTWTSEHSDRCPMNYEVSRSGCWEQGTFPPDCSSSFISSFPFGWVFPQRSVFSLLQAVTHSQLKTSGQRSPWLLLGAPPLWGPAAQPCPDSQLPFFFWQDHPTSPGPPTLGSLLTNREWLPYLPPHSKCTNVLSGRKNIQPHRDVQCIWKTQDYFSSFPRLL